MNTEKVASLLIMIVDDNPVDLFVGKRTMEISGYAKNVLLQSSAVEALKYLKENADQPKRLPNIIFLDLNMPLLNGFQFLQQFQALSRRRTLWVPINRTGFNSSIFTLWSYCLGYFIGLRFGLYRYPFIFKST